MFRQQRLLKEDLRFGSTAHGPDSEHADGLLAAGVKEAGPHFLPRPRQRSPCMQRAAPDNRVAPSAAALKAGGYTCSGYHREDVGVLKQVNGLACRVDGAPCQGKVSV